MRGYKTVSRFMPHEVAELEPLVQLLSSIDQKDHSQWQVAAKGGGEEGGRRQGGDGGREEKGEMGLGK